MRRGDDWKQWKRGWQYEKDAPHDKQWQKDREKLFRKNGNGWWWFTRQYFYNSKSSEYEYTEN